MILTIIIAVTALDVLSTFSLESLRKSFPLHFKIAQLEDKLQSCGQLISMEEGFRGDNLFRRNASTA